MKVLFVHNEYQQAGGEDSVLRAEAQLLESYGHSIQVSTVTNNSIDSVVKKIKSFQDVVYSHSSRKWMKARIDEFQPDVVHVHNFFPLLSPSIYDVCSEHKIPVIQTLHNYRLMCPGALLMRSNRVCEDCIGHSAYHSLKYKCYRNSFLGTYAVARMVEYHKKHLTWKNKVSAFIALTEFAKSKFIQSGLPKSKIHVKSNFLSNEIEHEFKSNKRFGALYVGRLSEEKGIRSLLEVWSGINYPLRIVGTGEYEEQVKQSSNANIEYLGGLSQEAVLSEMGKAAFLIMPSLWYEGFPMVIVEAFSQGLPVVASDLGSMAEIIEDGYSGLKFDPSNTKDIRSKVRLLIEGDIDLERLGENAFNEYQKRYTADVNYGQLMHIYNCILNNED